MVVSDIPKAMQMAIGAGAAIPADEDIKFVVLVFDRETGDCANDNNIGERSKVIAFVRELADIFEGEPDGGYVSTHIPETEH